MKTKSFIYVILAGLFWGTSGLFVSALSPYGLSPLEITAIRATVAAIVIIVCALIADRKIFRVNLPMLLLLIVSGLSFYGSAACYYSAMQLTSVSTAAVLLYTAPIMVMVYSVAFLGEKLSPLKLVSVVLMLGGCCFVSGIIGGLTVNLPGILLALLSGLCFAVYSVLSKIEMGKGANPLTASVYSAIIFSVSAIIGANPVKLVSSVAANPGPVLLIGLGLGFCTFSLPSTLYNMAMKDMPAGTASSLSIIEPISATVYAMIFLGQVPDIFAFLGIFMVLGAVLLLGIDGNIAEKKATRERIAALLSNNTAESSPELDKEKESSEKN